MALRFPSYRHVKGHISGTLALRRLKRRIKATIRDDELLHIWTCEKPQCGVCAQILGRRPVRVEVARAANWRDLPGSGM